jgi:hypothetical protein
MYLSSDAVRWRLLFTVLTEVSSNVEGLSLGVGGFIGKPCFPCYVVPCCDRRGAFLVASILSAFRLQSQFMLDWWLKLADAWME